MLTNDRDTNQFCSANMPLAKKTSLASQFCTNYNDTQHLTTTSSTLCPLDVASYKPLINPLLYKPFDQLPISNGDLSNGLISSSRLETSTTSAKSTMDVSSLLLNMSSSVLGDFSKTSSEGTITNFGGLQEHCNGYPIPLLREMQGTIGNQENNALVKIPNMNASRGDDQEFQKVGSIGFPFNMPFNIGDAWKSSMLWETSSCPCDVPSSYSTTKCYT